MECSWTSAAEGSQARHPSMGARSVPTSPALDELNRKFEGLTQLVDDIFVGRDTRSHRIAALQGIARNALTDAEVKSKSSHQKLLTFLIYCATDSDPALVGTVLKKALAEQFDADAERLAAAATEKRAAQRPAPGSFLGVAKSVSLDDEGGSEVMVYHGGGKYYFEAFLQGTQPGYQEAKAPYGIGSGVGLFTINHADKLVECAVGTPLAYFDEPVVVLGKIGKGYPKPPVGDGSPVPDEVVLLRENGLYFDVLETRNVFDEMHPDRRRTLLEQHVPSADMFRRIADDYDQGTIGLLKGCWSHYTGRDPDGSAEDSLAPFFSGCV